MSIQGIMNLTPRKRLPTLVHTEEDFLEYLRVIRVDDVEGEAVLTNAFTCFKYLANKLPIIFVGPVKNPFSQPRRV
jgi:hypothetical protein